MSNRRPLQVFSLPFLDMVTNYLGAVIILFLVAAQNQEQKPCPQMATRMVVFVDSTGWVIWGDLNVAAMVGDSGIFQIIQVRDLPCPTAGSPCPPCPTRSTDGVVYVRCDKEHYQAPMPCPPPGQCGPYAPYSNVQCNGEDAFTFTLTPQKMGECGTTWRDDKGRTGTYGVSVQYGPFPITAGKQKIKISDSTKPDAVVNVEVEPPVNCQITTPSMPEQPGGAGQINFIVEFNEIAGDRVGLRVKKGKKTVYINNKSEETIGYFSTQKPQEITLKRPKTGIRMVYQPSLIPGVYEIYLEATGASKGKNAVNAKLWLGSKVKPMTTKSYDITLSSNAGRQLVRTVEVLADGSLKVIK